jgi:hypothetical protein
MRFFAPGPKKKTSSPLPIIGADSVSSLGAEAITVDCSQRPERKEVTFGTRRQALELDDRKTGDATEVAEIAGQHLVAERKRRCSDQQIPERNHHAPALLLSVDFAGQQRGFFCVRLDRQIGQQFI